MPQPSHIVFQLHNLSHGRWDAQGPWGQLVSDWLLHAASEWLLH